MKLAIIGLVVLVLLGGGGFAGWWFFLAEEEEPEPEAQAMSSDNPQFIELKPFDVAIMEGDRVTHRVTFQLYLDLLPDHTARSLKKQMPKIQDAVYSELHALFGLRYVRDLDNILPLVKRRVREAADRALGGNAVGAVLIANVNRKRTLDHHKHELTGRRNEGKGRRILVPPGGS